MSVKDSHTLKQLETRLSMLRAESELKQKASAEAEEQYRAAIAKVRAVEHEIEMLKATAKEPVITEHALLRYLERVHGIDLDVIRQEMMPPAVIAQIHTLKSGRFPIAEGTWLVVERQTVKTVQTRDHRHKADRGLPRLRPVQFRSLQEDNGAG